MKCRFSILVVCIFCFIFIAGCGGGGGSLSSSTPGVMILNIASNDLVYDSNSDKMYLSIADGSATQSNTIVSIDPATGAICNSVAAGKNPTALALSSDGRHLYVGVGAVVRKLLLPVMTSETEFTLGNVPSGPRYAQDMVVLPDNPEVVVISTMNADKAHVGVLVYDNGVPRPDVTPADSSPTELTLSEQPSVIYGYGYRGTYGRFVFTLHVTDTGISLYGFNLCEISGFNEGIAYDNGLVYGTLGYTYNPATWTLSRPFQAQGPVLPDSVSGQVYILSQRVPTSQYVLHRFDMLAFNETGSMTIPGVSGKPGNLVKCGENRLAFRTTGNQVFIVNTSFID